ncbi:hypothetical protein V6N11_017147 [Hibiscus sabdariffa]|uniref:Uncharacterized protein n=1 Tax=Hibiscus sabdariffa TaxID=183260 RepID=A0ABR2TXN3_9ROSI
MARWNAARKALELEKSLSVQIKGDESEAVRDLTLLDWNQLMCLEAEDVKHPRVTMKLKSGFPIQAAQGCVVKLVRERHKLFKRQIVLPRHLLMF